MPDDLYWNDIVVWSEQQAELLRRAATGERVNGLDWPNLVEEVESVGRSQVQAVESLVGEALRHMLKASAWPESVPARHWLVEARAFLGKARRIVTPSMFARIDAPDLYAEALDLVRRDEVDGRAPGPLPDVCPYALADLLAASADVDELAQRLRGR